MLWCSSVMSQTWVVSESAVKVCFQKLLSVDAEQLIQLTVIIWKCIVVWSVWLQAILRSRELLKILGRIHESRTKIDP